MSLVTLPDGGGGFNNGGDESPDSAANKSTATAANATTNPYGDFGTASCRGQVSHSVRDKTLSFPCPLPHEVFEFRLGFHKNVSEKPDIEVDS